MAYYIKHGNVENVESWEREFRAAWEEEAKKKNDRIVGEGYAERQIADTLSKVEPIDVRVSMIGPNMNAYIKRGDAVDILAGISRKKIAKNGANISPKSWTVVRT